MKAISPMIAVVLLIAFTVAVGGLLSVWFASLTTSQTSTISSGSEALAKCASSSLAISEVRYPSSGSPRLVNVTLTSSGSQNLKNITITVVGGGASTNSVVFFNASGDDMIPGTAFATSISTTGGASLPPELVSANAFCQTKYTLSGSCKAGEPCMKPA